MGRKTYEVGLKIGVTSPYPHMEQFVFARGMGKSPDPEVALVSGDAVGSVKRMKQQPGKDIWLCGGGELAYHLFAEIDELILKVSPIVLGAGIPLFAGEVAQTSLELIDSKIYSNGCMWLCYRLKHQGHPLHRSF